VAQPHSVQWLNLTDLCDALAELYKIEGGHRAIIALTKVVLDFRYFETTAAEKGECGRKLRSTFALLPFLCKQDAQLSQKDRAAGCVIIFAKSRTLELGDNDLRTL